MNCIKLASDVGIEILLQSLTGGDHGGKLGINLLEPGLVKIALKSKLKTFNIGVEQKNGRRFTMTDLGS